jgi:hypothetical protein
LRLADSAYPVPKRRPMGPLIASMRDAWQAYTALILIAGAVVAFAGLPGRVEAIEKRIDAQDIVLRYIGCVLRAESDGLDPRPCNSHLTPDLREYLRPR